MADPDTKGRVLIEYWTGVSGYSIANLLSTTSNFTVAPAARECATVLEIPQNMASPFDVNMGTRIRGILYPPTSGTYIFSVASDNNSVLLLSTDATPAHATSIASVGTDTTSASTGYEVWGHNSAGIYLTAGQAYYIEGRHKQDSTAGGNFSIGWKKPGDSAISLMPATNVAPWDDSADYTANAVSTSNISQQHPRIALSVPARTRLSSLIVPAGTPQNYWNYIVSQCNAAYLGSTIPVPTQGGINSAAAELLNRVTYLGMNYTLNTDSSVRVNCKTHILWELQSAANWGSGWGTNGWDADQFLDLAMICRAYALAFDWCYAAWSSTQRDQIRGWIVTKGLQPALASYANATPYNGDFINPGTTKTYVNGPGNWTCVCNGAFITSALAILGEGTPPSSEATTILNDLIPAFDGSWAMSEWGPDGAWPEAPTYGKFAMKYLGMSLAALETARGTSFNMDKNPGISTAGVYQDYEMSPTGLTYNYGDNGGAAFESMDINQYLGLKFNQPVYSWNQSHYLGNPQAFDLLWYDPRGDDAVAGTATPTAVQLPTSEYFDNAGVAILRTSWTDPNALYAGMKGGYNALRTPYGSPHEQMEIGSFVFDALGVRWAKDLGRDSYSLSDYLERDPSHNPSRWTYYRARAEGNNTLVFDPDLNGGQSLTGTPATLQNFECDAQIQQVIIDMTSAYSSTPGYYDTYQQKAVAGHTTEVTSAKRGIRFLNGVAQVQDEVTTNAASKLKWFMHTDATVVVNNPPTTATLTSGGKSMLMIIQSPTSGATFEQPMSPPAPLSTSPNPTQTANTGRKLIIDWSSTGASSVTLTVALCPYVTTPPAAPSQAPLSSWGLARAEVENLAVAAVSPADHTSADSGASGGGFVVLDSTAVGNYVTFTVPNLQVANYEVYLGVKTANSRGICQFAVAGSTGGTYTNHGSPVDMYNSYSTFTEFDLGALNTGSAGDKAFRFTVTGKNAASTGYSLAFDYIRLVPH